MVLAGLACVALMLLWVLLRRRANARTGGDAGGQDWVVLDGSNVMYWHNKAPKLSTLREALGVVTSKGLTPCVLFDANAGYRLSGRYLDDADLAKLLGLAGDQVIVVGKGVQADPHVLQAARDLDARVVSNDQFRDWAKQFPQVRKRGYLIHGDYHKGKIWMDFQGSRARQP